MSWTRLRCRECKHYYPFYRFLYCRAGTFRLRWHRRCRACARAAAVPGGRAPSYGPRRE